MPIPTGLFYYCVTQLSHWPRREHQLVHWWVLGICCLATGLRAITLLSPSLFFSARVPSILLNTLFRNTSSMFFTWIKLCTRHNKIWCLYIALWGMQELRGHNYEFKVILVFFCFQVSADLLDEVCLHTETWVAEVHIFNHTEKSVWPSQFSNLICAEFLMEYRYVHDAASRIYTRGTRTKFRDICLLCRICSMQELWSQIDTSCQVIYAGNNRIRGYATRF
jgi:hypothetical protein